MSTRKMRKRIRQTSVYGFRKLNNSKSSGTIPFLRNQENKRHLNLKKFVRLKCQCLLRHRTILKKNDKMEIKISLQVHLHQKPSPSSRLSIRRVIRSRIRTITNIIGRIHKTSWIATRNSTWVKALHQKSSHTRSRSIHGPRM